MRFRAAMRALLPASALTLCCSGMGRATSPPASGVVPPDVSAAFERGLFAVPERPAGLRASSGREDWFIPIIRVEFPDSALVYSGAALEQRLFDGSGAVPTGSMKDYYQWVSGGRMTLRGEVVATVLMSHDRNYYARDAWGLDWSATPGNSYGLLREAISLCDGSVDFTRFDLDRDGYVDMLWIVHAGPGGETTASRRDLWSMTGRATVGWNHASPVECDDLVPGSTLQHMRVDRFTVLPELSGFHPGRLCEIGVFCHEFGHTLGLPDLYDTSALGGAQNVGPGSWSLMSTGAYGGDGASPESPTHMGAWSATWLGWANRVRPAQDTTISLRPIGDGGEIVDLMFQGEDSPEHYLIENRVREGFDRNLPSPGLLVSQVDEVLVGARIASNGVNTGPTPGVRILEADGDFDLFRGANRGDANDPFPGQRNQTRVDDLTTPSLRSLSGAPQNIALENITHVDRNVSVRVRVRAEGWQEPQDLAAGAAEPEQTFGPALRAVVSPAGHGYMVSSEPVGGRLVVGSRERPWLQPWQPLQIIDRGTGNASEPTIARIGASDLAVAWIETGAGRGQVCFRSRVAGVWLPTRVFTSSAGGCLSPAIAADRRGRVYLTWLEILDGYAIVRFMTFLYSAPYGQPRDLTSPVDLPASPAVAAGGDGHAYVIWPDRGSGVQTLRACRFHPDSGMSAPFRVGPNTSSPQSSLGAAVDSAGTLHVVWQQSPGSASEIHYQRRPLAGGLSPRDTTLDALGDGLQSPRIAIGPDGGRHVAYEWFTSNGLQVRYKRWTPALGWDHRASEVSGPADLSAAAIELLPTYNGSIEITWIGFDGSGTKLRRRLRQLDAPAVTSVPDAPERASLHLTAGPNPLRAGQALRVNGGQVHAGAVLEVMDASGRRLASVIADATGRASLSPDVTATWAPGLYFIRIRDAAARGRLVVLR